MRGRSLRLGCAFIVDVDGRGILREDAPSLHGVEPVVVEDMMDEERRFAVGGTAEVLDGGDAPTPDAVPGDVLEDAALGNDVDDTHALTRR